MKKIPDFPILKKNQEQKSEEEKHKNSRVARGNSINLNEEQIERYSAQIILKEIGAKGMNKLLNSTIVVVGAGSLGCYAINTITPIGIGRIIIIDPDRVEITNLPRQILYKINDVGRYKVDCIEEYIKKQNPDIQITTYKKYLLKSNIEEILGNMKIDYIIDASDNFPTKFLINDYCVYNKIPFVIAGVEKFNGQIFSIKPFESACYRCIFTTIPNSDQNRSCSTIGVLGTTPGIAGVIEANEAIKSIIGLRSGLINHALIYNLIDCNFMKISLKRDPNCKSCSNDKRKIYLSEDYGNFSPACY